MRAPLLFVSLLAVATVACGDNERPSAEDAGIDALIDGPPDTDPPDTIITLGPSAVETTATASFTFAAAPADSAATFECAIDGASATPCTSPAQFTLAEGAHTFAVAARDAAGNLDPSPATLAWTIDLGGPSLQLDAKPADPSNDPTPTFEFSSSDSTAMFQCQVDGTTPFASCTSPYTAPALPDGTRMFRVRATDTAQHTTDLAYAWTLDTVAPTVTITAGPGATALASPEFEFTTTGNAASVRCAVDTSPAVPCTSPFAVAGAGDGAHVLTVTATDAAGNAASATRAFTIDTIHPTVAVTSGPSGSTNVVRPTWTFTTTDAPTVIECSLDTDPAIACSTSFTAAANLAPGPHTFRVRVADAAGNENTASRNIIVDTESPVVAITGGPVGTTANSTPTFTFTVTGATSSAECRVDTGAFAPCAASFTTPALGAGPHAFEVQAADDAGNLGHATRAFSVDGNAPTISITGAPGAATSDTTPTFTFVVGANAISVACQVDSGPFIDCTSPFTTLALGEGSHTVAVRACSAFPACATDARTFVVDLTAPSVTITSGPQDPTPTDLAHPAFTFTTAGATATRCRVLATAGPSAFGACTSPFTIPDALADGHYTFEVDADDAAGNTTAATRAFTVDTQAPVVTIEAPLIAARTSVNPPTVFFTVTDTTTATTTCITDGQPATACDGTVGYRASAPLAESAHTYRTTARDAGGRSTTVTVSFVVDVTAPTVTITGKPTDPTNDDTPTFAFTTSADTSRARCDIDGTIVIDPCTSGVTFASLPRGSHTFHVTAFDDAAPANQATVAYTYFQGFCGDGTIQGTETCDGANVGTQTCSGLGFTAGTLGCTASCTIDTSTCSTCGNGVIETGEECDGANLAGATCASEGFTTGSLTCDATTCQRDVVGCSTCGDDLVTGVEVCDGTDVGSATCESESHAPGTLACASTCDAFSATACTGGFVETTSQLPATAALCANGLLWMSSVQALAACTTSQGIFKMHTSATGANGNPLDVWLNMNNGTTPITTLAGHGFALSTQGSVMLLYFTAPSPANVNSWRSVAFPIATPANIAWGTAQMGQAALPLDLYAGLPGASTGNLMAGYSAALGGAAIAHGQNNAAAVGSLVKSGVTGTVTSVAVPQSFTPSTDIWVGVLGTQSAADTTSRTTLETPSAVGGIFDTCNLNGTAGGTFVERDTGLGADKDRVGSITVDDSTFTAANTRVCAADGLTKQYAKRLYAAIRGGKGVYKTEDGGDTWTAMGDGLPTSTGVYQITIAGATLYAATSKGLYTYATGDAVPKWKLFGLEGKVVRSVVVANRVGGVFTVYVGVDEDPATHVYAGSLRSN